MGETDVVSDWSLEIAKEAAPDEVDLAPTMAYAFIAGGKEREELLRQSEGVPGAFGGEIVIFVFPAILEAIEEVGPLLLGFLSRMVEHAEEVSYFATALNTLVDLRNLFKRKHKADSLPDDRYAPLKTVSTELTEELRKAGVPQDQADIICYRVLRVMIENPSGAAEYTRQVTQAA